MQICKSIFKSHWLTQKKIILVLLLIIFSVISVIGQSYLPYEYEIFHTNVTDYDDGTFQNTTFNISDETIGTFNGFVTGRYISEVIETDNMSTWLNMSWTKFAKYGEELPANGTNETGYGAVNMTAVALLYHLNEDSGDIIDYSGNGLNGTIIGSNYTYNVSGVLNGAFDFPTNEPTFIEVSNNTNDFNYTINDPFTVSFWARSEIGAANSGFFAKYVDNPGTPDWGYYMLNYGSILVFAFGADDGGYCYSASQGNAYTPGVWHHIVAMYDGSRIAGGVRIITDTVESYVIRFGSLDADDSIATNSTLRIGWGDNTHNGSYMVDEFIIFNRTITDEEITNLYLRGRNRLNASIRACDDENCSGESFTELGFVPPVNLSLNDSKYIQYAFDFVSNDTDYFTKVDNISIWYDRPPDVNIQAPEAQDYLISVGTTTVNLQYTVTDNSTDSCWYSFDSTNYSLPSCANSTVNITTSSDDSYNLTVYSNDTRGKVNFNYVVFTTNISNGNLTDANIVLPLEGQVGRYFQVYSNVTCLDDWCENVNATIIMDESCNLDDPDLETIDMGDLLAGQSSTYTWYAKCYHTNIYDFNISYDSDDSTIATNSNVTLINAKELYQIDMTGFHYGRGENVEISVGLQDLFGNAKEGESLVIDVFYPNRTLWLDDLALTEWLSGVYSTNVSIPETAPYGDYRIVINNTFFYGTVFQIKEYVDYIEDSIQFEINDIHRVIATDDYTTEITMFDMVGKAVTPDSAPILTITDSLGTEVLQNSSMAIDESGVYRNVYATSTSSNTGEWFSEVKFDYNGETIILHDRFQLISNPTQVSIEVTSICDQEVCANILIENEGITPYEYQYFWWLTDSPTEDYDGSGVHDSGQAAKLVNPGEQYVVERCLTLPEGVPSTYFRAKTYYGEYSFASDYFNKADYGCLNLGSQAAGGRKVSDPDAKFVRAVKVIKEPLNLFIFLLCLVLTVILILVCTCKDEENNHS